LKVSRESGWFCQRRLPATIIATAVATQRATPMAAHFSLLRNTPSDAIQATTCADNGGTLCIDTQ